MIRKLFVVLMLLVLLPSVLAPVDSNDWDGDGTTNTNDQFPLDRARATISDGTDHFNSAKIEEIIEPKTSYYYYYNIKLHPKSKYFNIMRL